MAPVPPKSGIPISTAQSLLDGECLPILRLGDLSLGFAWRKLQALTLLPASMT
jgi:hypothetical protein